MSAQEIQKIEQNIKDKREQLARERDALVVCEIGDQARIKQRIRMKKEEIRDFEQEKWQIIAGMVANWRISDDEAQQIVTETVIEVQAVSGQTHDVPSTEILELLQEILAKLNEPGKPAAARLKAAFSVLPPFVSISYEAELDTESTFQRYLPTFSNWIREVRDRPKK
ncbi:MAG: hypothetical protein EWV49_15745 [Microcystis aeruginosa Ma_QC_Ch_20071001_S25]|jgi:hypothetical protein|uniref:Uncharacterized protein n=1 Tax=Microcystis aeruginosa Ma_QC_Ch_20071001_S25D TaxID=2486250 RepID=A0A552FLZ5_MICAE|nr:hypothetical protein [Microcystis aeruginosa SX13-11]NCR17554.1 hypothetical protein [Microcystis aeruginosa LL13-03]NCR67320.1 hypothetical protein [Microcystis aeruginosa LL11-07]NCS40430.1 hypothetical protein [Microcystis aeruginosa BS13-10]NCT44564.1 hypothetical protein [Microcystis aeruginosa G11-09]TRU47167.1 MAG: hypothetical protein EWV49_15745 [Microcystis aeruginosa Ma_QC_Ch_20071001_S25]TRU47746.1 MAG: hypothetical protein EWV57_15830 [Microcystis aeruginosa Ma_QC_Ch_20071001_